MRCVDVCAGIGGRTMYLPVEISAYVETCRWNRAVLHKRQEFLQHAPIHDSIRQVDFTGVDMVTMDLRKMDVSELFEVYRPMYVFMEHIQMMRGWRSILSTLHYAGYNVTWSVITSNDAGAPHLRKRWFALAKRARDISPEIPNFLSWVRKMVPHGALVNGDFMRVKPPFMKRNLLDEPLILRRVPGLPGGIPKAVQRFLWATPGTQMSAHHQMGKNSCDNLPSQLRFEVKTKRRLMYANPDWVEWMLGYPIGWTNLECKMPKAFVSWQVEPCARMVEHLNDRMAIIHHATVPQQSRIALEVLLLRYIEGFGKKRKRGSDSPPGCLKDA